MADNDRTLDPVDALKTEHAASSYEFPTSESMATDGHSEPSAKSDDHSFREASQSWDAGNNGSTSGDLRSGAKNRFGDMQDAMSRKYRVAADTTDDFVHDNPWRAIAIAALAGVVVGMLTSR